MLRNTLMTAAAAAALLAAPVAFAQDAPTPAPTQTPAQSMQPGVTPEPTTPAATPVAPAAAPAAAPATTPAQAATPATPAAQPNNVIDVLKAQGNFTTLLSALDQAQLTDTLASRSAVTIFAPTDAAFAALSEADRTRLLDPANAQELRNLLLYHVIVADVTTDQIKGARGPVDTAGGAKIQLDGTGEMIKADGATVVAAEVDAGNGGIYAIDKVLNPTQSMAAMGDEEADATDAAPAEAEASTEADTSAAAATPATPATPATTPAPGTPGTTTPVTPTEATTPANPAAPTTTTRPAAQGETAPTGQPADVKATTQAPTVPNPTDGQQDEGEEDEAPATPQS
jgi:uncharacterized surface protein with fasciclin (FAS1) repeats